MRTNAHKYVSARGEGTGDGMTLREHFAGLAMQGLLAETADFDGYSEERRSNLAIEAVRMADALIEELNKCALLPRDVSDAQDFATEAEFRQHAVTEAWAQKQARSH